MMLEKIMSEKDVIVEVLKSKSKRCTKYVRNLNGGVDEAISYRLEFTPNELAQQILDSLPRLSGEISSEYILEKLNEDEFDAELYRFLDDEEVTFRNAEYQETRICMLEDLCNEIIKKVVTKICSLVPEQQTVQEFAEEVFGGKMRNLTKEESELIDNHIEKLYKEDEAPAGEVIASGKLEFTTETNFSGNGLISTGMVLKSSDGELDLTPILTGKKAVKLEGQKGTLVWVPDKEDK